MENINSNSADVKLILEQLNKNGVIFHKIENGFTKKDNLNRTIKPNALCFTLVKGCCTIVINDKEHLINGNSLIIFTPEDYINTEVKKNNLSGYAIAVSSNFVFNIHVKSEFALSMLIKFKQNKIISLTDDEALILASYFEIISKEEQSSSNTDIQHFIYSGIITSLVYKIYEILNRKYKDEFDIINGKSKSSIRIFKDFFALLLKEFKAHRDVLFYANSLCVSSKYLSSIVKDISGTKASKIIESFVISEAKRLLKYSDMSIQEIAYDLNFPNPSFFGSYFKKYVGKTPGDFRKE